MSGPPDALQRLPAIINFSGGRSRGVDAGAVTLDYYLSDNYGRYGDERHRGQHAPGFAQ